MLVGFGFVAITCSADARQSQPTSGQPAKAPQPERGGRSGRGGENGRGQEGGLLAQMTAFKTEVPAHPFDIVLVRPTRTSMSASVVSATEVVGRIEYSRAEYSILQCTPIQHLRPGEPALFNMTTGLEPDGVVHYTWVYTDPANRDALEKETPVNRSPLVKRGTPTRFGTVKTAGHPFTFTIQADSHLDANVTPAVYLQTLANALADKPDFHVDLGDTFMTDKRVRDFKDTLQQYVAQRYYFGQLCHSAPLFMVLGNHDGEVGYASDGPHSMAAWSFAQRTKYFPAPEITNNADGKTPGDGMYSGRTSYANGQGANYYEFTWGDAQFIVLDPFWFTTTRPRGGGGGGPGRDKKDADIAGTDENWSRTLGKDQYDWLTRTLEGSKAKYRFVFIHHLVGGLGKANRGGMESSVFFEWGGKNADGTEGFAEHRPGWTMPIHDLLVKHHVSAVFHGHDHLYVHSERDGVTYQCVPQPGNPLGGTRSAEEYGYTSGKTLGSPGHMRIRVGPERTTIEFIRSSVGDAAPNDGRQRSDRSRRGTPGEREANAAVVDSYELKPAPMR